MIKHAITFVVGAGASQPYGLPTGAGLAKLATDLNEQSDAYQSIVQALRRRKDGTDSSHLNDFLLALQRYSPRSIDDFLEKYRDDEKVTTVGRVLIAALIGKALREAKEPPEKEDWLLDVLRTMRDGADTHRAFVTHNAPVRFVTFNFDNFIEERIRSFVRLYPRLDSDSSLDPFPVIHVHGQVPAIPADKSPTFVDAMKRDFDATPWLTWVDQASKQINVTADTIGKGTLNDARAAIRGASILCFLGFSYNATNLIKRLGIPAVLDDKTKPHIYGSAKDLSQSDRKRVETSFGTFAIDLGSKENGCRAFLDQFYILRET